VFTVAAAAVCRHVVAVDVSPAMTAVLRRKVADLGLGNVSVVEAGFLSYEHAGDPPGFVFTRNRTSRRGAYATYTCVRR
jgi:16S rRNA C967 or C1407 C5-methylase (RsmB/RsmF family)